MFTENRTIDWKWIARLVAIVLLVICIPIAMLLTESNGVKANPGSSVQSQTYSADGMNYRIFYTSDGKFIGVVNVTESEAAIRFYNKNR